MLVTRNLSQTPTTAQRHGHVLDVKPQFRGIKGCRAVGKLAEDAAAVAAIEHGATYPTLAAAARTARQTAWKLYRPR